VGLLDTYIENALLLQCSKLDVQKQLSSRKIADHPGGLVFEDQFGRIFEHIYPHCNWQQLYEKFRQIAALLS